MLNIKAFELPRILRINLPLPRSFFDGPFCKGDFKSVPQSLANTPKTSPKRSARRRNESPSPCSITIHKKKPSIDTFSDLTEKLSPKGSMSARDYSSPIAKRPPSQGKTPRAKVLNQVLTTEEQSGIKNYLDFLETTPRERVATFALRMRQKSETNREGQKTLGDNSISEDNPTGKGYAEEIIDSISALKTTKQQSQHTSNSKNSVDLRLSTYSRKDFDHRNSKDNSSRGSSLSLAKNLESLAMRLRERRQTKVKPLSYDEQQAKMLSDEISKNYEMYLESAATKDKHFSNRMEEFLRLYGVYHLFSESQGNELPLNLRLYQDMLELVEMKGGETSMKYIQSQVIIRKPRHKMKLVQDKFQAYKVINQEIMEINADFRVFTVKNLGKDLTHMHVNLLKKKTQVYQKVSRLSFCRFGEIKDRLEALRDPIEIESSPVFNQPGKKKVVNFENTVNMRINQGLEDAIALWKKKVANIH